MPKEELADLLSLRRHDVLLDDLSPELQAAVLQKVELMKDKMPGLPLASELLTLKQGGELPGGTRGPNIHKVLKKHLSELLPEGVSDSFAWRKDRIREAYEEFDQIYGRSHELTTTKLAARPFAGLTRSFSHMREMVELEVKLSGLAEEARTSLVALFPQSDFPLKLRGRWRAGDPALNTVLSVLVRLGFKEKMHASDPLTYDMYRVREPEEVDFQTSDLFRVHASHLVHVEYPAFEPRIAVRRSNVPPRGTDICVLNYGRDLVMVRDSYKNIVEQAGFIGFEWTQVPLVKVIERGGTRHELLEWKPKEGPWWIMGSSFNLWPPADYFRERRADFMTGALYPLSLEGNHIIEPGYRDVVLAFKRDVVHALGPFDIAGVSRKPGRKRMVISKRVREYCLKHNIELDCRPVRILD